jgi:hypothetical protein
VRLGVTGQTSDFAARGVNAVCEDQRVVDDAVAVRLADLEESLRRELAGRASVTREAVDDGRGSNVSLVPFDNAALRVGWTEFPGYDIFVGAGRNGRWELGWNLEDADLTEQVVRAVVAGRVEETFGPARTCVEVTYSDGVKDRSTNYRGCLVWLVRLPGWRRFGRKITYPPYAATGPRSASRSTRST